MLKLFTSQSPLHKTMALSFSFSAIVTSTSLNLFNIAEAKPYKTTYDSQPYSYPVVNSVKEKYPTYSNPSSRRNRNTSQYSNALSLSVGTNIPVVYEDAKKILVTKDESLAITVRVIDNVTNQYGEVVIPRGSEIMGEIQPSSKGSRFVAQSLILPNQLEIPIVASSAVVTRTETVQGGKNTGAIWQGAAAGAAAATIIAGITGDTAIATEEVLGGAGFGALAGFLFGGNDKKELISIDTQRDLDLTLRANLVY